MSHNLIIGESEESKKRTITVLTAYQKEYLKDDIQQMLRERLKYVLMTALGIDSIQNVFFLELIIQ